VKYETAEQNTPRYTRFNKAFVEIGFQWQISGRTNGMKMILLKAVWYKVLL
jgi:hypothetical protein